MQQRRALAVLTVVLTAVGLVPAASASPSATRPAPGAAGAGDPYFPRQGNTGYDVAAYGLDIGYTPATRKLTGTAIITATATQPLSRFNLDLRRNLVVSSVRVDGAPARFAQPASQVQELVISPRRALRKGHRFSVQVRYAGTAQAITDPDGAIDGFIPTDDGAFVASEPQGSPTWFPVNDTPRDKATYAVSITVPKGLVGVSNGAFLGRRTRGATTTWSWRLDRPVSSYLITASIGKFDVTTGRTPSGIPYFNAVDPTQAAKAAPVLAKQPAIVDYFQRVYGRYPFGQIGAIVDNAPNVGYALETATRPVYDRAPDVLTLAHEIAHQWYGNDVTLARWRDIWINEGFAEFSSWLWDEHSGGKTTAKYLADLLARPASDRVWTPPPADPRGPANIFSEAVYTRGAGTLAALRQKLGDRTFFAIMRGWVQQHRYGNATVPQFTAYAQRVAHRDLRPFFAQWLYKNGKPTV